MHVKPCGQHVIMSGQQTACGPGQQPQFEEASLQHVSPSGQAAVWLQTTSHAPPPSGKCGNGGDGGNGLCVLGPMHRFPPPAAERRMNRSALVPPPELCDTLALSRCHANAAAAHEGPFGPQSSPLSEHTTTGASAPLVARAAQSYGPNCFPPHCHTLRDDVPFPYTEVVLFQTIPPYPAANHPEQSASPVLPSAYPPYRRHCLLSVSRSNPVT